MAPRSTQVIFASQPTPTLPVAARRNKKRYPSEGGGASGLLFSKPSSAGLCQAAHLTATSLWAELKQCAAFRRPSSSFVLGMFLRPRYCALLGRGEGEEKRFPGELSATLVCRRCRAPGISWLTGTPTRPGSCGSDNRPGAVAAAFVCARLFLMAVIS